MSKRDAWFVVLNPNAARGRTLRFWTKIENLLARDGIAFVYESPESLETIRPHVQKAASQGFRKFLSIGGDGSLHMLLNALLPWEGDDIPTIGVIPCGTGNDWAHSYNIPTSLADSVGILKSGTTRKHGVALIKFMSAQYPDRFFINVAGLCLDAEVVRRVALKPRSKMGALAYLKEGVMTLFSYQPPRARITTSTATYEDRWMTIHAGIGKFSGGGMSFTPHGGGEGDTLAITGIRKTSNFNLLLNIYRLYVGTIRSFSHVVAMNASNVLIESTSKDDLQIEADGEYLGSGSVQISAVPAAIRIVVPA